jgi:hypothetical protein
MNVQVRTQRPPTLFYWISLFVLIAIVFAPFAPAEAARAGTKATNINSLLDDYSRYLSSDTTAYKTAYSSEMADLVQEVSPHLNVVIRPNFEQVGAWNEMACRDEQVVSNGAVALCMRIIRLVSTDDRSI